jgi:peptide/nickel transport system permease protein
MVAQTAEVELTIDVFRPRKKLPLLLKVSSAVLCAIIVLAFAGTYLSPYQYDQLDPSNILATPSLEHPFGTDEFGRDILTRVMYGTQLSLLLGVCSTLTGLVLGVPLGLISGYYRGWVDEIIMRSVDILMSFPPILFALLALTIMEPSIPKLVLVIGFLFVPSISRILRSVTLDLAQQEFIEAAIMRGESRAYILFREILPNAWAPIIVEGSLRVTFAILIGAVLSFLGFGVQPPSADWGMMISQGRNYLQTAPWIALAPGAAMALTVVAVNLFGDGLREWLDPKSILRR